MRISKHATDRLTERFPHPVDQASFISTAIKNGRKVRPKNPVERARKAVYHNTIDTAYYQYGEVIVVVTDNTVVSVYSYGRGERSRWEVIRD